MIKPQFDDNKECNGCGCRENDKTEYMHGFCFVRQFFAKDEDKCGDVGERKRLACIRSHDKFVKR